MKDNLTILHFGNSRYHTIYNEKLRFCLELEVRLNQIHIVCDDYSILNLEKRMASNRTKMYYQNIEGLLSKDSVVVNIHLRIILTKLNILYVDS
jgi:hypothetical protein